MQGRIALIGARGYLGRALVPRLMQAGYHVTGIGRRLPHAWPGATFFHICDATDAQALRHAIDGCDGVINAMCGSPAAMLRVAAGLTACRARGWRGRLVQISSLAVYGQADGVLDEASEPLPHHAYGRAKHAAEHILLEGIGAEQNFILRPGCLYGPGAPVWVDRLCRLLLSGRLGWLWDEGAGICPLMHVDDMARVVTRALTAEDAAAGVYNLPFAEEVTWNTYIRRLASGLGMISLPRMSSLRLDVETYLHGPARAGAARLGVRMPGRSHRRCGGSSADARASCRIARRFCRRRTISALIPGWRSRSRIFTGACRSGCIPRRCRAPITKLRRNDAGGKLR